MTMPRKIDPKTKKVMKYSLTFFFDQDIQDKIDQLDAHFGPYAKFDKSQAMRDGFNARLDEIIAKLGYTKP